jgi:hypothetical protein
MKGRLAIFLTVAVVLVVLAALNAASYVRVETEGEQESVPDRSTQNAGPTGTRALFEYLRQTGHDVMRWSRPPETLLGADDAPATFVVVGRLRREVEEEEAEAILEWVREGGRLVVVDRSPEQTRLLPSVEGWRISSEIFDYPDLGVRPEDADVMTRDVRAVAPSQPTSLVRDVAEVQPSRFASRLNVMRSEGFATVGIIGATSGPVAGPTVEPPPAPRRAPGADADDARDEASQASQATPDSVSGEPSEGEAQGPPAPENENSSDDSMMTPLAPVMHLPDWRQSVSAGRGPGALLVDYQYGLGRIVVLSDPYILSNAGIRLSDNLFLAVNIVTGAGGRVAFDEYHQGYGAGRNELLAYFAGTPILWMFGQAGVLALALVWTRGRRFGRPLPAPRADRRSKLEFVASMAELQLRARAYDLAVENVYARTRRALARYGGTRADAPAAELATRVAARSGKRREELEKLLLDCEGAIAGERTGARRALSLVRSLRALERELGLLMRSREIRQAERDRSGRFLE